MSAFAELIDAYCKSYQVQPSDKNRLLAHYPYFKCLHLLEYGRPVEKLGAKMLYPAIAHHRLKHKIKCVSGEEVDVTLPFDRYDFGSFKEVIMAECYALPAGFTDIEVIVDLGGNTGMASLYYLARLPDVRRLIVVEANPNLIAAINNNLAPFRHRSGLEIETANACIGDGSSSHVNFTIDANHRHSKMGADDTPGAQSGVRVPVVTLRRLLDERGIDQVDLLKMDIEGAEFSVLADADILRRFRCMHIEVHGSVSKRESFVQQVQRTGFEVTVRNGQDQEGCEEIFFSRRSCQTA